MFMFESELTLILYCLLSALAAGGIQFLLCRKAKGRFLVWLPAGLLLAGWVFTLLTALGVFGTGSGFLGNLNLLAAAILAIILLPVTIGVVVGWLIWRIKAKAKNK